MEQNQADQYETAGAIDPAALGGMSRKRINTASILAFAWGREAFTASDVLESIALTRTTIISLCEDLVANGWLTSLPDARSTEGYSKGRPARRYCLNANAGVGVGIDAGATWMVAHVVDLRGEVIGRAETTAIFESSTPTARRKAAHRVVDEALHDAGVTADHVLRITIAIPAPVDKSGASPAGADGFWTRMNARMGAYFEGLGMPAGVENDATLAALAEGFVGQGRGTSSFLAFLSKDGLGAGFVSDGHPVRGYHGAAGELWMLDYINPLRHKGDHVTDLGHKPGHPQHRGITAALGIDSIVKVQATRGAETVEAPGSTLTGIARGELTAATVVDASLDGDSFASEIVEDVAHRLTRTCLTLGGLLDVESIIFSGLGPVMQPLIDRVNELTPQYWHPNFAPPPILLSDLGADVVVVGAASQSVAWIRNNVLELVASPAPAAASR